MNAFDWAHCRTFLAIARTGSLSAAARRLGVAQPTVRRHLEALEGTIGSPLFVRSQSGLVPTPLAEQLVPRAEAIADEAAAFLRAAQGGTEANGTVRITASHVVAIDVLPPILRELRDKAPNIDVELVAGDHVENLLHRGADIAVRMVLPKQGDVVARRIGAVELGLYATKGWIERHEPTADLAELVMSRALIGFDREGTLIDALDALGVGAEDSSFAFRSDDTRVHAAAARAGLGVAVMQVPLAEAAGLERLLPQFRSELPVWLAVAPGLQRSPTVRLVADALAKGLTLYLKR